MLFQLTYKDGIQAAGSGFIEAGSLEKAEELGREWCKRSDKRRYISVRDAVLMREEAGERPQQPATVFTAERPMEAQKSIEQATVAGQKAVEAALKGVKG
jgi:hypothetical protein